MSNQPEYVEYAFNAIRIISTEEWIQEDIEAFTRRWGGIDLSTFRHVLQHGHGEDRMIAAFAIGHTHSTWASDLLYPFLQNEGAGLRWAAALSLSAMNDERARPVLIQALQEFLPPPHTPPGEVGHDWFDMKHMAVAALLSQWKNPSVIAALRETLVRVWQVERDAPAHKDLQMWSHYEDALAYALGRLGTFDMLATLDESELRKRLCAVNMAMGYLNVREYYRTGIMQLLSGPIFEEAYQELLTLLLQVLQQKIGLSRQEATSYLQSYCSDYFDRWDKRGKIPEL